MLALKLEHVSTVYQGSVHALDSMNLEVQEGDFFALLELMVAVSPQLLASSAL